MGSQGACHGWFMAAVHTKFFFPLQYSFLVSSAFFLGLSFVACTNLHALLLVLHIFQNHMDLYPCNSFVNARLCERLWTNETFVNLIFFWMYSGAFYLTEAGLSLAQNEKVFNNPTHIPVCLLRRVFLFSSITNILKA